MAAKIGILGESTTVTHGSDTTVYTVPADKAARVRILFAMEGGGSTSYYWLKIGSTSDEVMIVRLIAGSTDMYSGIDGAGSFASNANGLVDAATINVDGVGNDHILIPYPAEWFLSTGDTVKFNIGGSSDAVDHLIQLVGVEDDA